MTFEGALCAQTDPALWFPEHEGRREVRAAFAICRRCPLIDACLDYALTNTAGRHGLWAGTTTAQREALRRAKGLRYPTEVDLLRDKILARLKFGWDVEDICADLGVARDTVTRYMREAA